jgi:energy-coupling factor transporter ATP-binding protein EcfA2
MPKIRRLDVRSFRGIRSEVALIFDSKSILLFGENGTGKSSFVDALEKLFTRRVSTLDGRAQGLSSDRHGPHIYNGHTEIKVTFDDSAATNLALDSNSANLPDEIQDYVQSARQNLYILRRKQVLDFIDSQPRERYALLRPFLPLSQIENLESELRSANEHAETRARQRRYELARLIDQQRRLLSLSSSSESPSEDDLVRVLSETLETVSQPRLETISEIDGALRHLESALAPFGDLERQSRLSGVSRDLGQLDQILASGSLGEYERVLTELRANEAQEARVFYEAVLQQGIRWVEEESRTSCPFCEQTINPIETVAQAKQRLESMRKVLELRRQAQQSLERARQTIRSAQQLVGRMGQDVRLMMAEDRADAQQLVEELSRLLTRLSEDLTRDLSDQTIELVERATVVFRPDSSLRRSIVAEQGRLQSQLASLPSPDTAKQLLEARDKLTRAKELHAEIDAMRSSVVDLERQAAIAARLHEDARTARREEVQSIYDELSQDIDRLYTALHPDESHGGIHLEVRDVGQGSANLKGNFYDRRDEDIRAYYSDAHLDTLGLSIFLALRRWYRREKPAFNLLVLDDVLTSVDIHHVVRLSELLLREFSDYQMLLTTHDRIWFEHLRDIQARCRVASNFINKIIHGWTIEEGPDIREPENERQDLDHVISEGSGEDIAVLGGRLLEHILQEMRYSLRLSVQAKRGELYEIGDLWPRFYAAIKKNYPTLYSRARSTLDSLDVRWPVRNWIGAHRNNWARNIPRNTAVEFARAVGTLFDLLFCPACRRFVEPSLPLGQLACRCGEIIYPAAGKEAVPPKSRDELIKDTEGALQEARLNTELFATWKRAEATREN